MVDHSFSIHAHFYQPPRENPLTGKIPIEASAVPFSNWNERIHEECYRPNAELGNYGKISFNFGPTLFNWMQRYDPVTYQNIIQQDQDNLRHHGVGNAMAQAYNHTILPLNTTQDKITQIYWGLVDFEQRFRHKPQGMWLPETAVDRETLEILAQFGVQFTILAPWQAETEDLDPSQPYRVKLSEGRSIVVFFYQSDLSGRVSFDPGVTINADAFARQYLKPAFHAKNGRSCKEQFILVASDGELYGHHQQFRELFLARLVDGAVSPFNLQPMYPGLWLKNHPPKAEIRLREETSWSCHHGVGRWAGGCPCTPGGGKWKTRLRLAFDHLTEELDQLYVEISQPLVANPWKLRDRYIHVMNGQMQFGELLAEMAVKDLKSAEQQRLAWMLESQRLRQQMYTSCGWFFADFDGIEPRNNVANAASSLHLAELASGTRLETTILHDLEQVVSPKSGLRANEVFLDYLQTAKLRPEITMDHKTVR